mgnify:CR=1 FL=1
MIVLSFVFRGLDFSQKSELLIKLFGEVNGKHARTAIGVAELPLDSPVEIELTVEIAD